MNSDSNRLILVFWLAWMAVLVGADSKKCPNGDADCKVGERCAFEKSPAVCVKQ